MDEVMLGIEEKMSRSIKSLQEAFASVRTGRANAMILDKVKVDYYGVPTQVNQMAAIKTPDAHMLVVEPWDKSCLGLIEQALLASDLGVTPSNDGSVIRLPFPSLTEERRRELVKQCKIFAEEARVAIRNARRDGNSAIEKLEKAGEISQDDSKRGQSKIQKLTDSFTEKVESIFKAKEAEVMEI